MPDTEDPHGVAFQIEQYAIVAKPQPEGTGHIAMKGLDLPAAGPREMENAFENAHGGRLIQRTNVGPGFVLSVNPMRRHLLLERKVFRLEPEVGQDLFHRNAFAAAA